MEFTKGFCWRRFFKDPTVLFTIGILFMPILLAEGISTKFFYIFTPMLWISFLYLVMVLYTVHGNYDEVKLSNRDHRVALWFLMNGVYFNLFFDVVSGQLQLFGEMSVQYNLIEPKYKFGLYQEAGQSVFMTSMCELFLQSPLCLITYYAYHKGKVYKPLLEIIMACLHIAGVWWFYLPEIFNGFPYSGGWPKSLGECFTFHRFLYLWSAYFIFPAIWVVVPFLIAKTAWKDVVVKLGK